MVGWTLTFAFYVGLLPALGVNFAQAVEKGFVSTFGPIKPDWLAVVVAVVFLALELALLLLILRSLWVLLRQGVPRAARWIWADRGIVAVILVLLIVLFELATYGVHHHKP